MEARNAFLAGAVAGLAIAGPMASVGAQQSPPQVVLSTMHQMNQLEMQLGKLAEQKGATEDVRRFGDRLYRDHQFADGKVTSLATAQQLELLPADQLPAAPKLKDAMQKAQQLTQMSGAGFDSMFLQMMIQTHEMATSMLGDALPNLPAGPVHDLVSRLLPILRQHLALARDLAGKSTAATGQEE